MCGLRMLYNYFSLQLPRSIALHYKNLMIIIKKDYLIYQKSWQRMLRLWHLFSLSKINTRLNCLALAYFVSGSEKDISFVVSTNKRLYISNFGTPRTREYDMFKRCKIYLYLLYKYNNS